MFIAFVVMGAWVPVFTLYLKHLQFSASAVAWASASNAVGAMLAPLIWGQIADRWLANERCISLCALVSAVGLCVLARLQEPSAVIAVCMVLWFFLIPTIGLTGAYIFRQLEHPEREYGKIRLWGTVGWMAANWGLTLWFQCESWFFEREADLADSLRLGAAAGFVLAIYAWTLPHAPPSPLLLYGNARPSWLARIADAPLRALQLFRQRSFVVYCACMFGFYITVPFTIQLNPLVLDLCGVEAHLVPLYLTMAQPLEVALLPCLPFLLTRFGVKATMVLGAVAWSIGLATLGVGEPVWLILMVLPLAGVFICCFVIAGQVFVNRLASADIRASAQAILVLVNGSGLLLGHFLVGQIRAATDDRYGIAYGVAASLSAGLLVLFTAGFSATTSAKSGAEPLVSTPELP